MVLVWEAVCASTSASLPVSSAAMPKPASVSATMEEVSARSVPDAAAREITPSMPSSISTVSHPAWAMNVMASADCWAV